jgi:hypothetical protein
MTRVEGEVLDCILGTLCVSFQRAVCGSDADPNLFDEQMKILAETLHTLIVGASAKIEIERFIKGMRDDLAYKAPEYHAGTIQARFKAFRCSLSERGPRVIVPIQLGA